MRVVITIVVYAIQCGLMYVCVVMYSRPADYIVPTTTHAGEKTKMRHLH